MAKEQKWTKVIHVILWIAQVILAASLIWSATMKLFQATGKLAEMWAWTANHPELVKITGVLDLLAGIGLILPALLRVRPQWTIYAAYGIVALMIAAGIFHSARGESSQIGVNIFFAVIAIFIAWGRQKKALIKAK